MPSYHIEALPALRAVINKHRLNVDRDVLCRGPAPPLTPHSAGVSTAGHKVSLLLDIHI